MKVVPCAENLHGFEPATKTTGSGVVYNKSSISIVRSGIQCEYATKQADGFTAEYERLVDVNNMCCFLEIFAAEAVFKVLSPTYC